MILALSTSFAARPSLDGRWLLRQLEQLDVQAVELDYRLEPKVFYELKPLLKQARIAVVSLHNYCPFPRLIPKAGPGGDYFRLSALDREERDLAVSWTLKTMEQAHDLEAQAVVLHCGAVQMDARRAEVYQRHAERDHNRELFQELMSAEMARRAERQGPYLDALMFSLDRLLPAAERLRVTLGLENRFHYDELPAYEEMGLLMKEFDGAPLGFWHDSGHAHAQELLGLASQQLWLQRFDGRLVGAHLHDARGLKDHLAPGSGEIDLGAVLSVLGQTHPAVVELSPGTGLDEVKQGLDYLRSLIAPSSLEEERPQEGQAKNP